MRGADDKEVDAAAWRYEESYVAKLDRYNYEDGGESDDVWDRNP